MYADITKGKVLQGVKGKNHGPQIASLVLKAHGTKPRFNIWFNCSFNLSQKYKLNQPV